MDAGTFQSLIDVYNARKSPDLLSILIDEANGAAGDQKVLGLLRGMGTEAFSSPAYDSARKKAVLFCLAAPDFPLAARLSVNPKTAEDKCIRARALNKIGQTGEASRLYSEAVSADSNLRSRELEHELGLRTSSQTSRLHANVISLTSYSARGKAPYDRRDQHLEGVLDDLDENTVTFADVIGLDAIKTEIRRRIVLPYLKPSLFERFKRVPGGNLLLFGPPGCGKTLIGRAAAGESDARFFPVVAEDVLDAYAGDAENKLRLLLDEARSDPPAIVFFDDLELLAGRGNRGSSDIRTALTQTLLSELHTPGRRDEGVLIIAATNMPWELDPALFRSGRFNRIMFVGTPDAAARLEMIKRALHTVPGSGEIDLRRIVNKTAGLSGADVKALCDWVCDLAVARQLDGRSDAGVTPALFAEGLRSIPAPPGDWMKGAERKFRHNLPSELSTFAASVLRT